MEYIVMICDNCKKEYKGADLNKRVHFQLVCENRVTQLDFCAPCAEKAFGKAVKSRYGGMAEI